MQNVLNETYLYECVKLAQYYDYCKDPELALGALDAVWSDYSATPEIDGLNDRLACEILIVCGGIVSTYGLSSQNRQFHESAQNLLTRARQIAGSLDDRHLVAEADKQMAVSYWREGRYDNAIVYSNSVLSLYSESEQITNDTCLLSKSNLIMLCFLTGDYAESFGIISAIEPFVELSINSKLKTVFNNHAGSVFLSSGNYDKSITYFERAIRFAKESKNATYEGNILNNLSVLYLRQNMDEKAMKAVNESIALLSSKNLLFHVGVSLETKSSIFIYQNKLGKAALTIDESIALLQKGENYPHLCESLWTKIKILILRGEKRLAVLQFNDLLNITQQNLSLAITDKYIERFTAMFYLQTGGNFFDETENYRLHLLDNALSVSGGLVKPTAETLGISHQNVSALLKKYPALCKKHDVKLRTRKSFKSGKDLKSVPVQYAKNEYELTLESDRLAHLGLIKGMAVCVQIMAIDKLDLDQPVVVSDKNGSLVCGMLVCDFGWYALDNGFGEIEETYSSADITETGQVTGFYDQELDKYLPLSEL